MNDELRRLYYQQYLKGVSYKTLIGLYDRVKQNENFYIGRQWEGVHAPDLDKPVLNILGRVVSYLISVLVGERIGVRAELIAPMEGQDSEEINQRLRELLEDVFEENGLVFLAKDLIRNAAVDGDCCIHFYYDASSQGTLGRIRGEIIENTDIYFANPACSDKESQPYLLISARMPLEKLQQEMKTRGCPAKEINQLKGDKDSSCDGFDDGLEKVTVITRYEKRDGRVWVSRFTETAVIVEETEIGYSRYPIGYMSWSKIKNSFHGQAALTGMIPNQIAINKLMAMAIKYEKELGLHKVLYDRTKIDELSNKIGAIAVNGDPTTAIFRPIYMPELPSSMMALIDRLMSYTRDMLGASDAALGNIRPDNASAIVTVVKSTAAPLTLQKRSLYALYEEIVRIILDIASVDYGVRKVWVKEEWKNVNYSEIAHYLVRLNIDAGEGSFYSEADQIRTLDKLYANGIIQDPIAFLEAIPSSYLPSKTKLLNSLKEKQAERKEQNEHNK